MFKIIQEIIVVKKVHKSLDAITKSNIPVDNKVELLQKLLRKQTASEEK